MRARPPATGETPGVPDFKWINRELPVVEVAKALNLRFSSDGMIHCWWPERHHNGDRTASVGVRRRNNTVKCFGSGCGVGPLGPVDLVMDALPVDTPAEAGLWLAQRFQIPQIPRRLHLKERKRFIHKAGFEGDVGLLVDSGLWAGLSAPTRSIVPVLLSFAEREPGKEHMHLSISYRALARYSGVRSHNAISKALAELEEINWLERTSLKSGGGMRNVSEYLLTPRSDGLQELANTTVRQTRQAIQAEREVRHRQRAERAKTIAGASSGGLSAAVYSVKALYA